MHETRFEGIVIGHENWKDADRVISFYTPHFGKLEVVAKGARYEKSKLKGHLELLTHGEYIVAQNRGRGVLIDAATITDNSRLQSNIGTAYFAHAVADMYDAYLFAYAPDPVHWDLLYRILRYLNAEQARGADELGEALRGFAKLFLQGLGYLDETSTATAGSQRRESGLHNGGAFGGAGMVREYSSDQYFGTMRGFDELLTHTDIAGPTFSGIEASLRRLAK